MKFLFIVLFCSIISFASSCKNPSGKKDMNTIEVTKNPVTKPPSSYTDTFKIDFNAAVFYSPDSLQLQKISQITEHRVYEGSMHEYDSQFRNSHKVLKKDWPAIRIVDLVNFRFVCFIKENGSQIIVDLDSLGDPYGLLVFNRVKDPEGIDMTNVDTQLYYYFSK